MYLFQRMVTTGYEWKQDDPSGDAVEQCTWLILVVFFLIRAFYVMDVLYIHRVPSGLIDGEISIVCKASSNL